MTDSPRSSHSSDDEASDEAAVGESETREHVAPESDAAGEPAQAAGSDESTGSEEPAATGKHSVSDTDGALPDDTPTGEVITGPIRYTSDPATHAYSESGKPPTKQMDALDSGAFTPVAAAPPPPPPPSSGAPVMSSPSAKRGRGRTIGLIVAAVVLLVVIAGVGSELYVRHKVTSCLQTSFENLTGTGTDVSVSRRPMLMSVVDGDVPWVQVDTTGGGDSTMQLHARAEGISTDGGTVQSLQGNGFLPYERIQTMSQEGQNGSPTIESISADPSAGTIKISTTVNITIIPIPATVTLKPVVKDGAVSFEVKDATALMFGLPSDFAQPIVDQVTAAMFGPLFKQIHVTKLDVGKSGIDFAFAGDDVNLKSAAESTNASSGSGGCAV